MNSNPTLSNVAHPQGDREAIARIIDRSAFEEGWISATKAKGRQEKALRAADTILALSPAPDGDYALVPRSAKQLIAIIRTWLDADPQWGEFERRLDAAIQETDEAKRLLPDERMFRAGFDACRRQFMISDGPNTRGIADHEWEQFSSAARPSTPTPGNIGALREALKRIVGLLGTVRQPIPDTAKALKVARAALSTTPLPDAGESG